MEIFFRVLYYLNNPKKQKLFFQIIGNPQSIKSGIYGDI